MLQDKLKITNLNHFAMTITVQYQKNHIYLMKGILTYPPFCLNNK